MSETYIVQDIRGDERVKFEPKSSFANERVYQTVFHIGFTILLLIISKVVMMDDIALDIMFWLYIAAGLGLMTYAVSVYYYRYANLDASTSSNRKDYNIYIGPFVYTLAFFLIVYLSIFQKIYNSKSQYNINDHLIELIQLDEIGSIKFLKRNNKDTFMIMNSQLYVFNDSSNQISSIFYVNYYTKNNFDYIDKSLCSSNYNKAISYDGSYLTIYDSSNVYLSTTLDYDIDSLYFMSCHEEEYKIISYSASENLVRVLRLKFTKKFNAVTVTTQLHLGAIMDSPGCKMSKALLFFQYFDNEFFMVNCKGEYGTFELSTQKFTKHEALDWDVREVGAVYARNVGFFVAINNQVYYVKA